VSQLGLPTQERFDNLLPVYGIGYGLPHAHVVERRALRVDGDMVDVGARELLYF
jgi:hypothetical protein